MGLGYNITIASLCCRNCAGIRGSLGIRGLLRKVTEHFYPCQPPLSTTKRPCTVRGRSQEASHSSYWSTLLAHVMCFQKTKLTLFQKSIPSASLSVAFVKTWEKYKGDWNQKLPDIEVFLFFEIRLLLSKISQSCILVQDKQKVQWALEPDTSRFLLKSNFQFWSIIAQFWR